MFQSILGSSTGSITALEILACTGASLVMGLCIACVYMFRSSYTKQFVVTLAILPVVIQSIIMVVNGNLGAGVAVMGAFGLVRFRSVPGTAREISSIFLAMAVGLAAGMGYVAYAALFTAILCGVMLLFTLSSFGEQAATVKQLKITLPEDMDYNGAFDDLFADFTRKWSLEKAKTVKMGSLYEVTYLITEKDAAKEKELLDRIRQRNGNLAVSCGRASSSREEL